MARVRALVALTVVIRHQARDLMVARDVSSRCPEPNALSALERLIQSHRMLHDEVRLVAWNLLLQSPTAVGAAA